MQALSLSSWQKEAGRFCSSYIENNLWVLFIFLCRFYNLVILDWGIWRSREKHCCWRIITTTRIAQVAKLRSEKPRNQTHLGFIFSSSGLSPFALVTISWHSSFWVVALLSGFLGFVLIIHGIWMGSWFSRKLWRFLSDYMI